MLSTKLTAFTKIALLGTVGLALGGAGMSYYQKHHRVHRSIASIKPYQPHGLVLGKQAAAMSVEIVGPETYPDNNTEVVELVGYITQHLSADTALTYEWSLPDDVTLMRGPVSSTMPNLKMGQPYQVSILVSGFSREAQKLISLKTQIYNGSNPLTTGAIVVSRPEDTVEQQVLGYHQARAAAAARREASSDSSSSESK